MVESKGWQSAPAEKTLKKTASAESIHPPRDFVIAWIVVQSMVQPAHLMDVIRFKSCMHTMGANLASVDQSVW